VVLGKWWPVPRAIVTTARKYRLLGIVGYQCSSARRYYRPVRNCGKTDFEAVWRENNRSLLMLRILRFWVIESFALIRGENICRGSSFCLIRISLFWLHTTPQSLRIFQILFYFHFNLIKNCSFYLLCQPACLSIGLLTLPTSN
jgi:hypothetical protein